MKLITMIYPLFFGFSVCAHSVAHTFPRTKYAVEWWITVCRKIFEKIVGKLHISFPSAWGWVQIFDLANESHTKDVQENEHKRSLIGNSRLLMRNFRSQCDKFAYDDGDNFKKLTNYELRTERPGGWFLLTFAHAKVSPPRTAEIKEKDNN